METLWTNRYGLARYRLLQCVTGRSASKLPLDFGGLCPDGMDDEGPPLGSRKSRSSGILLEQEAGATAADVCRKHGTSGGTFYTWNAKYGGMDFLSEERGIGHQGRDVPGCVVDDRESTEAVVRSAHRARGGVPARRHRGSARPAAAVHLRQCHRVRVCW